MSTETNRVDHETLKTAVEEIFCGQKIALPDAQRFVIAFEENETSEAVIDLLWNALEANGLNSDYYAVGTFGAFSGDDPTIILMADDETARKHLLDVLRACASEVRSVLAHARNNRKESNPAAMER